MTWSYDQTLTAVKDQVRFRIGDTESTDPQLSDEEIAFLITEHGPGSISASIAACDALIAKYSRLVSTSQDGVSESHRERLENYQMVKSTLENRLSQSVAPVIGTLLDPETGEASEPFFTRRTPETIWGFRE